MDRYEAEDTSDLPQDKVGGHVVQLSRPYRARVAPLVGRETELEMITAAWMTGRDSQPLAPLLLGEPGVGKNRQVYEMARRTGKPLFIFQGHEDVTAEDLAFSVRFSDVPGKMEYVASALVTAMHQGGICFIDEIAKIRPRALALLVSVLDERRYIDSVILGSRVYAQPGFRFVAATNTADLVEGTMPEFLRSRLRPVISIGYPPKEEIDEIVASRFPRLQANLPNLLDKFWELWSIAGKNAAKQKSPTPRDVIYVFDLAISLADFRHLNESKPLSRSSPDAAFPLDGTEIAVVETRDLERSFDELFHMDRGVTV